MVVRDGALAHSALIAVECPSCGAKVDFPEDACGLECAYCRAQYLIAQTGRIPRFFIRPSVSSAQARAVVSGTGDARLVYVPYWRCRGTIYYWTLRSKAEPISDGNAAGISLSLGTAPTQWDLARFVAGPHQERRLAIGAVDETLCAGPLGGLSKALGNWRLRAKLSPYDAAEMQSTGEILPPLLPETDAMARITQGAYESLVDYRSLERMERGNLVGRRVSLIWYPFWLVPGKQGPTLAVDGTTGDMIGPVKPARPAPPVAGHASDLSIVPARCPQCNGNLSTDQYQPLKFCGPCQAAWMLLDGRLQRQPLRVIPPKRAEGEPAHLPLWRLRISIETSAGKIEDEASFRRLVPDWDYVRPSADPKKPIHLYVEGWGNRISPHIGNLAHRFTRAQPDLAFGGKFERVLRALFGPEEAAELALIELLSVIFVRDDLNRLLLEAKLAIHETELLLVPCHADAQEEWIDDLFGMAVPRWEVSEIYPGGL